MAKLAGPRIGPLPNLASRRLAVMLGKVMAMLIACSLAVGPAVAAPVSWQEVPASAEGRQWWDAGSLRWTQDNQLRLLSRFQPAAGDDRQAASELYVMEVDCQQHLYRDVAVNGLHRFRSPWQLAGSDALINAVIDQACQAAPPQA